MFQGAWDLPRGQYASRAKLTREQREAIIERIREAKLDGLPLPPLYRELALQYGVRVQTIRDYGSYAHI